MAFSETYIAHLLLKKMTGALTAEETAALENWRLSSPVNQQRYDELTSSRSLQQKLSSFMEADAKAKEMVVPEMTPRLHFLRRWSWAAAVILLLGAAAYFWVITGKTTPSLANTEQPVQLNIMPGGNKAILTLADGSAIILDSAARGQLALQGNTRIIKDSNGKVSYKSKSTSPGPVAMNSLATPRGGQYQLTLPDGTQVWLNAASSITFPTAFTGHQRKVEITGEVYFEVTRNKQQPFIVAIKDRQSVKVLGTRFNVNGYSDEPNIQTSLIEGSVMVQSVTEGPTRNDPASIILQPGQQAVLSPPGQQLQGKPNMIVNPDIDIEKVIAWKKGLFNFNGADVPTVMRQLERWYDIHVQYESTIPAIHFKGGLDRGVNLSGILKILPEIGIRYRMEGRTLIVL
jgi:transmembrane sensor